MKKISTKFVVPIFIIALGLLVLTVTLTAKGSDKDEDNISESMLTDESNLPYSQDFGRVILKTLLSLALVIGILLLFMFGMKWLSGKASGGSSIAKQLQIYGSLSLGPKKALYLVHVVNRVLVLGVTENNVSLISEITDEKEIETLLHSSGREISGTSKTFASFLAQFTKKAKP